MNVLGDIQSNVKFASALASNLAYFDSRGFDEQGYYASTFLSEIALDGFIQKDTVVEYLAEVERIYNQVRWLRQDLKLATSVFISELRDYVENSSVDAAKKIIAKSL